MKEEYFWSIVIEQDLVQVGVWAVRGDKVAIVANSSPFSWKTDDDLVQRTDEALSEVVSDFAEEAEEPSKTVFGVPASWVEDGKIKKPHLEKIRLVSQKLSLTPTGFVVLPEAIAHSVKIREGSPLSGIIIGVGTGSLDVTVFRLGNIVGTVSVGRSGSVTEDVIEGLSRFSVENNMPTRWLLYDGREVDLEEVRQELIKTDWKEVNQNLRFLHAPQIEIVSTEEKTGAVSIAGASEISEITGVSGEKEKNHENDNLSPSSLTPSELGFVVHDVAQTSTLSQEEFFTQKKSLIKSLSGAFLALRKFRPSLRVKNPLSGGRRLKVVGALMFLVVIGLIGAWVFLSEADIVIYIAPKSLGESEVVVLDENIKVSDASNFAFPAEVVSTEVSAEKEKATSGTRTVGDVAKGKVVIRNGTASEVVFDSGTRLTGPNNLQFMLSKDATIPEASSPSSPGEVSVEVAAADIGEEYNLASGESFLVGNYPKSEVDAVSDGEITGGTSREVVVVSEADISSLREELLEETKAQALRQLRTQANGSRFIGEAVTYKVLDESFSKKVGDEAPSVNSSVTLSARGIVLPEDEVKALSELILKDQIPKGFSLRSEQVEIEFTLVSELDDGVWEFDISLTANLLPIVDTDVVKKAVVGKRVDDAKEYLSSIPGHVRAEIARRPNLSGFLGNMPWFTKNISIEIEAER